MTHFNEAAKVWDTPEKIQLNKHYAEEIKLEAVALTQKKEFSRILEVGCGTGLLGSQMLDETNTLLGIDTSQGMLDVFNEKFKGQTRVRSQLFNLETDDLQEEPFDLILSSMAFHHLVSPGATLSKIKKLLTPEGLVAVIDLDLEDGSFHPDPQKMGVHHSGFSEETIKGWQETSGLTLLKRKIIHTIHKNEKSYPVFLALFSRSPIRSSR